MKKLTNYSDICSNSRRSSVSEICRSTARIHSRIVNPCSLHVQYHHIICVTGRKAVDAVRFRAAGVAGGDVRVQLAVDGRQSEVDEPVRFGRTPAVRHHTVHRKVGLNIHHLVAWTKRPRLQQPCSMI